MILRHHITALFTLILKFIVCSIWRSVFSSSKELKHMGRMLHAYPVLAFLDIACSREERFVPILFELIANEKVNICVLINYVFSKLVNAQIQSHLHYSAFGDKLKRWRLLRAMQGASGRQELYVPCWR